MTRSRDASRMKKGGRERKRRAVEQAVTRYYNGLSEHAQVEDQEWGEFSWAEFLDGTA